MPLATYGDAVPVIITDGSDLETSLAVGGGTQYTEGDTDATITGTAVLWEDTSDTLRAVSAAKPLPVQQAALAASTDEVKVRPTGAANLATSQVALTTAAATAVIARATRRHVTLLNLDTAITIYVGPATVTSANGFRLKPGEAMTFYSVGLIQAIAASGTPTVAVADEYD